MNNIIDTMKATARTARSGRAIVRRIVTPCCRTSSTLKGKPAPRYTCDGCGHVYTSLKTFVHAES